jgi:heat shock protein HslJ
MAGLQLTWVRGSAVMALMLMAACHSAPPLPPLIGSTWLAEDLAGRGVIDRAQTTLTFERDSMVAGSTACNRYSASAEWPDGGLQFGQAIATRRACPPAVMEQEQRLFTVLEETRAYKRDANYLWLLDGEGRTLARFTPQTGRR